jgi:hypothetical protein
MSKNIFIITAIIVAVIAIGATAIYITLRQEGEEMKPKQPVITPPKIPEEPIVQPEEPTPTEPIDISDWKTYRNEEYGFEVKYPKDWYYITNKMKYQEMVCFNPRGIAGDCTGVLTISQSWNSTFQKEDPPGFYPKEWEEWLLKNYTFTKSTVFISGIEGKLYKIDNPDGWSQMVYFKKNGYIYNFGMIFPRNEIIFNKMLNSFRFIK